MNNWKAPQNAILPDFIIGGAMKSGTTTLHHILALHPDIFIPKGEIHFFDIDNILQHSDFNYFNKKSNKWTYQNLLDDPEKYWNWYSRKFEKGESKVLVEDSTTYLASPIAAQRIALQEKNIKMIFILRDPVIRSYSQYIHMVNSNRVFSSFEDLLMSNPAIVIERSMYLEQVKTYIDYLGKQNIFFILLEEFIENKKEVLEQLLEFMGVSINDLPSESLNVHVNKSKYPKYFNIRLLDNNFYNKINKDRYSNRLPQTFTVNVNRYIFPILNRYRKYINPLVNKERPPLKHETKQFLTDYFKQQLAGLSEIVEKDLEEYWYK
ncbi:MAG: sulfotransferase family protein [Candidatus Woesearchaeota archaeon]